MSAPYSSPPEEIEFQLSHTLGGRRDIAGGAWPPLHLSPPHLKSSPFLPCSCFLFIEMTSGLGVP